MIPFLVCFAAFVIVFLAAQGGTKAGAYLALCGMLVTLLGMFAALRYWFVLSRWLNERQALALPLLAILTFWSVFVVTLFVLSKIRQQCTDAFESVLPSLVDRMLGGLFGCVAGLAVMSALMMTLSIASPMFWPGYNHDELPLPLDRWPLQAYRFIETDVARIGPDQPGHTPLPVLNQKAAEKPADFWH
jgi:uncharacterized membrane protein required for colicin V production